MEGGGNDGRDGYSYRVGMRDDSRIGRRECLKLLGAATATVAGVAAGSGVGRAASGEYGEAGFGEGLYGGDGGFGVSTRDATGVDATSATLVGELSDLGGADSAGCYFEWRSVGASSWNTTATRTLSKAGPFSADISGLSNGTDYEYRAVAAASDGDTGTGRAVAFATDGGNTAPLIDSYSVTEAGSPDPHCEITAEWSVSDADGDLEAVGIEVVDAAGSVVMESTTSVSGDSASGTDTLTLKHVRGQTFDVTVTVTDAAGNSDRRTREVAE